MCAKKTEYTAFARQIEFLAGRFIMVDSETVQRSERVVGKAGAPFGAASPPRPSTTFVANVTALLVEREIFDIKHRSLQLQLL